jgi:hypothetical protein
MSSASIIYFWLHFDNDAKAMIYDQCSQIEGFNVAEDIFGQAFDFNPQILVDATQPAEGEAAPAEGEAVPAEGQALPAEGEAPAEPAPAEGGSV